MDAHHGLTGRHRAPRDRRPGRRTPADRLATAVLTLVLVLLAGAGAAALAGFRVFSIDSGSMSPALHTGDLVISRGTPARDLRPGDVVTYDNPVLNARVTHRVVRTAADGDRVTVETRGDANDVSEQWSAGAGDRLGRTVLSVPGGAAVFGSWPVRLLRVVAVLVLGVSAGAALWRRLFRVPVPGAVR